MCLVSRVRSARPLLAAQKQAAPKPPKPQISDATRQKAAEDNANPDALVLADFQKRVDAYMAIQQGRREGFAADQGNQ